MTQIRLNAEGLSQASSTLRSQGNELEGLITQMQNVINALLIAGRVQLLTHMLSSLPD